MPYDTDSYLSRLPTEVLLFIFTALPAKDLTLCRRVCVRFKQIIDGLTRSDALWRDHCKNDFERVYKIAHQKARPRMTWFNIYRSLSLWPKLLQARETRDEFAAASSVAEEILTFKILRDGIIGVHTKSGIVYYDIETLVKLVTRQVEGEYLNYTEDDRTIVILGCQLHLFIIRKLTRNPRNEFKFTLDSVKTFILVDQEVYCVNVDDEIFVFKLDEENLTHHFIGRTEDGVICLGFTDHLHVLTFKRNIYTLRGKELVYTCSIGPETNLLHILNEYNFLERMDWRIYFQWMYVLKHTIPQGPLQDIVTVRVYGDITFVGSNWGVLRIYHAPFKDGQLDIFNSQPIKQYNFMERSDCPVLSMCPILEMDVLESVDGHTLIVAMPKKLAVLNFTHSFKRPASVAMLPYSDVQRVKMIKMADS